MTSIEIGEVTRSEDAAPGVGLLGFQAPGVFPVTGLQIAESAHGKRNHDGIARSSHPDPTRFEEHFPTRLVLEESPNLPHRSSGHPIYRENHITHLHFHSGSEEWSLLRRVVGIGFVKMVNPEAFLRLR